MLSARRNGNNDDNYDNHMLHSLMHITPAGKLKQHVRSKYTSWLWDCHRPSTRRWRWWQWNSTPWIASRRWTNHRIGYHCSLWYSSCKNYRHTLLRIPCFDTMRKVSKKCIEFCPKNNLRTKLNLNSLWVTLNWPIVDLVIINFLINKLK